MVTSQYIQINEHILLEYQYTDRYEPETHETDINGLGVEVLHNGYTNEKHQFTVYNKIDENINVRDYSAISINEDKSKYVYLNRDLPLQYLDFDDNLTSVNDLLATFNSGYEIAYDTVRIHLTTGFNFDEYDGYIFDFYVTKL